MKPISTLRRRLLAMVWFGTFAFLAVSGYLYPLSMTFRARFLYVALPAISGGIAGYALGGAIFDLERTEGYARAIVRGIGVALAAFAIFAALFAVMLPLAEPLWGVDQMGGLFLATLTFGFVMASPVAIVAGGMAGASLFWFSRRR
jgi:hypothetical protein